MAKFYTCRFVTDESQRRHKHGALAGLCLKPTVTDTLCQEHEAERLASLERRKNWPLWPQ